MTPDPVAVRATVTTRPNGTPVPVPTANSGGLYADPAAWAVLEAARRALGDHPGTPPADTGVVVCTETACRDTVAAVRQQSTRGRIRPRHFAAAGSGTLAGLPCMVLGFRGPTLVLPATDARARAAADLVASLWLAQGQCRRVVVAEHTEPHPAEHVVHVRVIDGP